MRQAVTTQSNPQSSTKGTAMSEDVASDEQAITTVLAAIDAGELALATNYLRDDVTVLFGNFAPLTGAATFTQLFQHFTSSLRAVRHEIHHIWPVATDPDVLVATMTAHYTRNDGERVSLPCCNVFRMCGGLIAEYRVYMDISPAMAAQ